MMETAVPGLHDAILLGASIAGVYLVVALLQLAQIQRRSPPTMRAREPSLGLSVADKRPVESKTGDSEDKSFAMYLRRTNVEADLQRLQHEVQSLREALSATQKEMKSLQPQRNHATAGPLYNEAMLLARRGLNAASIATRCGISMGEAELVIALMQTPQEHKPRANHVKFANKEPNERQHLYGFRAAA